MAAQECHACVRRRNEYTCTIAVEQMIQVSKILFCALVCRTYKGLPAPTRREGSNPTRASQRCNSQPSPTERTHGSQRLTQPGIQYQRVEDDAVVRARLIA